MGLWAASVLASLNQKNIDGCTIVHCINFVPFLFALEPAFGSKANKNGTKEQKERDVSRTGGGQGKRSTVAAAHAAVFAPIVSGGRGCSNSKEADDDAKRTFALENFRS